MPETFYVGNYVGSVLPGRSLNSEFWLYVSVC